MDISELPHHSNRQHSVITAVVGLIVSLLAFLVIGPIIGLLFILPFIEGNILEMGKMLETPTLYPQFKVPLYILQGVAAVVGLIIVPWIFLIIRKEKPSVQYLSSPTTWLAYGLTALVVISFMGFNTFIIEWNANVHLPDSLRVIEEWAREKENLAAEITRYLTDFDSTGLFILAIVVIAIIPAIGEELVFRGIFQKKLQDSGMNAHLAIWIAAIVFSAIHIQFFGFIPRLFLGALFGYLYWWSGDLRVPILAHFVNNGFTLALVYWYNTGTSDINIEEMESPDLATGIILSIITAGLLLFLYRYWQKKRTDGEMAKGI